MDNLPFDHRHYAAVRDTKLSRAHFRERRYVLKPLLIAIAVCLAGLAMICLGQA